MGILQEPQTASILGISMEQKVVAVFPTILISMYLFGELLCTADQLLVEAGHTLHIGLTSEPGTVDDFEPAFFTQRGGMWCLNIDL